MQQKSPIKFSGLSALIVVVVALSFIRPTTATAQGIANIGDTWCGQEKAGSAPFHGTCTDYGWTGYSGLECAPGTQQPLGSIPECKPTAEAQRELDALEAEEREVDEADLAPQQSLAETPEPPSRISRRLLEAVRLKCINYCASTTRPDRSFHNVYIPSRSNCNNACNFFHSEIGFHGAEVF